MMFIKVLLFSFAYIALERSQACTNILVTNSGSAEFGSMIGDNDDTAKRFVLSYILKSCNLKNKMLLSFLNNRFGAVTHFESSSWPEGSTRNIYDFETSVFKGTEF